MDLRSTPLIFGEFLIDNCLLNNDDFRGTQGTLQLPAITMKDDSSIEMELDSPEQPVSPRGVVSRTRRAGPAAMALVIGLAALTAQASESDLVRDIQRYCTVCWRNARLDPTSVG